MYPKSELFSGRFIPWASHRGMDRAESDTSILSIWLQDYVAETGDEDGLNEFCRAEGVDPRRVA